MHKKGWISQLKNNQMMARIIRQIPAIIKIAIPTMQMSDQIKANIILRFNGYDFLQNNKG